MPGAARSSAATSARATAVVMRGRRRATEVAHRLGIGLRQARLASGLRQSDVAEASGVSQPRISELERGLGTASSLAVRATVASGVGEQFVGFLERAPGAGRPRDHAHLRRQELVIRVARPGGWKSMPEATIDPLTMRSRSVDVLLERPARGAIAVVEIWDWFDDGGAAMRSLDGKLAGATREGHRTAGLRIVRRTRQNRSLLAELHGLFGAKFPAPSRAWLRALRDPDSPMPTDAGLLWTDVAAMRLVASRLRG